ncbi:MAG: hypothetical protein ABWZ98_00170 [Nakamurella sp.]
MTLPSGDGTVGSAGPDTALDEDAAPDTGLEPDTAGDAAGASSSSAAADVGPTSDPDVRDAETPDGSAPEPADDDQDSRSLVTESHAEPPSTVTELDGPALENDEMRAGTADLQSSEKKSQEARAIADDLTNKTQPSAPDTVMPG